MSMGTTVTILQKGRKGRKTGKFILGVIGGFLLRFFVYCLVFIYLVKNR